MTSRDEVEVCVDLELLAGREAVRLWRKEAEALGIPRWEQEEMAAAFEES